jgi:hypothetical protein
MEWPIFSRCEDTCDKFTISVEVSSSKYTADKNDDGVNCHLSGVLVLPQQLADHGAVGEAEQLRAHLVHFAVAAGGGDINKCQGRQSCRVLGGLGMIVVVVVVGGG